MFTHELLGAAAVAADDGFDNAVMIAMGAQNHIVPRVPLITHQAKKIKVDRGLQADVARSVNLGSPGRIRVGAYTHPSQSSCGAENITVN